MPDSSEHFKPDALVAGNFWIGDWCLAKTNPMSIAPITAACDRSGSIARQVRFLPDPFDPARLITLKIVCVSSIAKPYSIKAPKRL